MKRYMSRPTWTWESVQKVSSKNLEGNLLLVRIYTINKYVPGRYHGTISTCRPYEILILYPVSKFKLTNELSTRQKWPIGSIN